MDDLDHRLRRHLGDVAPAREPEHLFDAVMKAASGTRQRPRLLALGVRDTEPSHSMTFAPALIVLLLIVALVAVSLVAGAPRWLRLGVDADPSAVPALV